MAVHVDIEPNEKELGVPQGDKYFMRISHYDE